MDHPRRRASRTRWAALLAAAALLPGSAAGAVEDPPVPPPPPAGDFQGRVDGAIDRGVAWLRSKARPDGSFGLGAGDVAESERWVGGTWTVGANALAVYTLAACGAPLDDPVLVAGFARIREDWGTRAKVPTSPSAAEGLSAASDGRTTYFVSLCLMALDAAHNRGEGPMGKGPPGGKRPATLSKGDARFAAELAGWLVETQDDGGGADLLRPGGRKSKPRSRPVPTGDHPSVDEGGGWGYGNFPIPGYHDHSNSQFAILGLKAAARLGVEVPRETWIRGLRHFLAAQEAKGPLVPRVDAPGAADPGGKPRSGEVVTVGASREKDEARGWGYMCGRTVEVPAGPGRGVYASMTAGGVSSLVIARSELDGGAGYGPGLRALTEKGIRDGLAWLAHHWGEVFPEIPLLEGMPPGGVTFPPDTYLLYGLERACILGGVARIGTKDWYRVGAERLLADQRKWGAFGGMRVYGSLVDTCFSLLFLKRAVFRVPSRGVATEADAPSTESVDTLLDGWAAAHADGREGIRSRLFDRGKGVLPDLILRLSDASPDRRRAALGLLRALTGLDHGYDPAAPEAEREEAVLAWEAWWMRAGGRLVADPAAGRFVERE